MATTPSPWQPKWLLGSHLAAALLLGSWLLPATRAWWDRVDNAVFYLCNGTLTESGPWQNFWAIANWRPFDLVAGVILLFLTWKWFKKDYQKDPDGLAENMAAFLAFALLVVLTNVIFQQILHALEYRRISPSGVLPGAIRLSEIITWIRPKDYSGLSFPSDHGFVLIAAVVLFWNRGGAKLGILATVLLAPFVLPRLYSGGHWLTDTLVGATLMALISQSWWFATPAREFFTRAVLKLGRTPLLWSARILSPFLEKGQKDG